MNPELQRQWWLELSPARLITHGAGLGVLFVLVGLLDARFGLGFGAATPTAALLVFVCLAAWIGGQRVADALLDELRAQTWDMQRLSALSPWSMTWGKWLGATTDVWLGSLLCLAIFLQTAQSLTVSIRALFALEALGGALLVQILSLIGALALTGHPRRLKGLLGGRLVMVSSSLGYAWLAFHLGTDETVRWYGQVLPARVFCTGLLWVALVWGTLGAYRLMAETLQVRGIPWAWVSFLLFAGGVAAGGYVQPEQLPVVQLRTLAAVVLIGALGAAYLTAFNLPRDPLFARRLCGYARASQWRRVAEETPLWIVALGVGLVAVVVCVGTAGPVDDAVGPITHLGLAAFALWAYAARDLLLLLGLGFGPRAARAETTAVLILALLYWVIPALCTLLGLGAFRVGVRPPVFAGPGAASLILLVQLAGVGVWTWRAYQMRMTPQATGRT